MIDQAELKSRRQRVKRLRADSERWWTDAPGTKRNREVVLILMEAQALAMTLIVDLIDADSEISMLRAELIERQAGIPRTTQ